MRNVGNDGNPPPLSMKSKNVQFTAPIESDHERPENYDEEEMYEITEEEKRVDRSTSLRTSIANERMMSEFVEGKRWNLGVMAAISVS